MEDVWRTGVGDGVIKPNVFPAKIRREMCRANTCPRSRCCLSDGWRGEGKHPLQGERGNNAGCEIKKRSCEGKVKKEIRSKKKSLRNESWLQ